MHQELREAHWFLIGATFQSKNTLNTYVYSSLEAITKEIANAIGYEGDIIYHIDKTPFPMKLKKNEIFQASLILPLAQAHDAILWTEALETYFQDPWNARNIELLSVRKPLLRNYQILISEKPEFNSQLEELCLEFLTPLPFNPKHPKKRTHIELSDFLNLFLSRIDRVFGIKVFLSVDETSITFLPYWEYSEYSVNSASQRGSSRYINGCIGKVYLKGDLSELLPLFLICEEIHTGSSLSYGRGYYIFRQTPVSFIDSKKLSETLQFYVEKNIDQLSGETLDKTLSELYNSFITAQHQPQPAQAFTPEGTEILTEKLHWKDRVLQSLIYKLLKNPIDNILPLTVFSFRPHFSEKDIKEKIEELMSAGFNKAVLFSLEGFYKKIDHQILLNLLREVIPRADHFIVKLIEKFLKVGYIYEARHHTSDKGIPLGSPISPMLSNIYLLKIDKALNTDEVVALRNGDTYLLMSQTEDAIESTIRKAERLLREIGLKISKKSIKNLSNTEISFAGVKIEQKEKIERLRKPLYIINNDFHLSIQSETVKISNSSGTLETIPLSRVSELVILADTTITSPLLKKFARKNIPVVISSNFKSPLIIARKDYKSLYDSIIRHTNRYYSLSEEEILTYAKEIANLKIKTYELLFTLKRHPQKERLIEKIRQIRLKIAQASNIDTVRGYEATASKENYQALNALIKNPIFHIRIRQRENPDYINSLINLLNHIVFNKLRTIFHSIGLNPYLGFLHSPENTYESLCADIHELIRARIDGIILNLVNLRIIEQDDFQQEGGTARLKTKSIQKVINYLEEQMNRVNFRESQTLYDFIYLQTERIKNWASIGQELKFEIPW